MKLPADKSNPLIPATLIEGGLVVVEEEPRGRGRPCEYTPEIGDKLIGWMRQGYSLTAAAGAMGVARQTLYNWMQQHPELLDSYGIARAKRAFRLESDMLNTESAVVVNRCRFALVNAAPEDWREKQDLTFETPKESPLAALAAQLAGTALRPKEES